MQEAIWVVMLLIGIVLGVIGERWRVLRAENERRAAAYAARARTRRRNKLQEVDQAQRTQQ